MKEMIVQPNFEELHKFMMSEFDSYKAVKNMKVKFNDVIVMAFIERKE
jgi:hypothetical protein